MNLTRPVLRGRSYAISSRKPQATQTAERILRAGGNAFDAAVAAMGVLAVTDPSMTGIGGDANVLVFSARDRKVTGINATGTAARLATIDWYRQNAGGSIPARDGLLCGTVPGVPDACWLMLDRWGSMSFRELLAPAIELAENGFPISENLAEFITAERDKLSKYPTTARIYLTGGGVPKGGDILRNPDLARTLRALVEAEDGAASSGRTTALRAARDRFYRGDIALRLAAFSEQNGGLFRYSDFARYEARIEEPVSVNYRGYEVYKNASACQGPTELMLLNLLEGYDLRGMGHNSAEYLHLSAEAAKLAYADREKYLGDMDFIRIPYAELLSKDYARNRRKLIDMRKVSGELRPGTAAGQAALAQHQGDTSYVAIVDREGNAVSFTPSLHSPFGTGVVMGDSGLIFNCRGDCFELDAQHPNALMPGKRPRSTLTPTLVLEDGRLSMVLGSPGGDDQPLRIGQTFLNIVDFGMNIQEAIDAPRWSTTSFPATEFPHAMFPGHLALEDRIDSSVRQALAERGHSIEVSGGWTLGANCGIVIDAETGVLSAGADPRGDSYALAW